MVSVGEADFLESHSFYEDLLGLNTHRTIPAPVRIVPQPATFSAGILITAEVAKESPSSYES